MLALHIKEIKQRQNILDSVLSYYSLCWERELRLSWSRAKERAASVCNWLRMWFQSIAANSGLLRKFSKKKSFNPAVQQVQVGFYWNIKSNCNGLSSKVKSYPLPVIRLEIRLVLTMKMSLGINENFWWFKFLWSFLDGSNTKGLS